MVTVLTLAVREDLGGFQLFALERRVKEDFGGIDQSCFVKLLKYRDQRVDYEAGTHASRLVRTTTARCVGVPFVKQTRDVDT